jgi:hypothetical protein
MSECKFCGTTITWVKMGEKNVPLNPDGVTVHKCKDGVVQPGIPVSQGMALVGTPSIQVGTKSQYAKKFDADEDRQKLIVWQSCMKIAIEAIAQVGDFDTNDESHARRIAYMTYLLYEESLSVWRTGKLRPDIPAQYKEQINQMTP